MCEVSLASTCRTSIEKEIIDRPMANSKSEVPKHEYQVHKNSKILVFMIFNAFGI